MEQFAGFHLVFTEPLRAGVYTDTNPRTYGRLLVGSGPIAWRGTSPSLTERGKTAVRGGGKTAVDCSSGLFIRVLLGPLSYEP